MSKEIKLAGPLAISLGLVAIVDDEDYDRLSASTWLVNRKHGSLYAGRTETTKPDGTMGYRTRDMHQDVLYPGLPGTRGLKGDHPEQRHPGQPASESANGD